MRWAVYLNSLEFDSIKIKKSVKLTLGMGFMYNFIFDEIFE